MKKIKYKNILVTGGAGFVGSFLADKLIDNGYFVRILDNLEEQVHQRRIPKYLNKNAHFFRGDIRSLSDIQNALKGIDAIFHLASAVGVGQSNYEIRKYVEYNILGTANLLEILVKSKHNVRKLVTISSMTGYGEGNYLCTRDGIVRPPLREEHQLKKRDWNLYCPVCKELVEPISTDETALDFPNSIYGFSKKAQQDMALIIGRLYKIPTVVLRGFNIYGPRQSLSNPYTGVTAIFISRLKNNQPAVVFEDGLQTRDFVSVYDVVRAFILSLEKDEANFQMFNIGSGYGSSILEVAQILSNELGKEGLIQVNQQYRKNDIRHCFADITKAKRLLGWEPKVTLRKGFRELVEWSKEEKAEDKFFQAQKELKRRGLL